MNRSINQTLSRTINTSLTTLLPIIAMYIWGGEVISNFAFAFLIRHRRRYVQFDMHRGRTACHLVPAFAEVLKLLRIYRKSLPQPLVGEIFFCLETRNTFGKV